MFNATHAARALRIVRQAYAKAIKSSNPETSGNWASWVDRTLNQEGFETTSESAIAQGDDVFTVEDDVTIVAIVLDESGSAVVIRRLDSGEWTVTEGEVLS